MVEGHSGRPRPGVSTGTPPRREGLGGTGVTSACRAYPLATPQVRAHAITTQDPRGRSSGIVALEANAASATTTTISSQAGR